MANECLDSPGMVASITTALADCQDRAAVELALTYARSIDNGGDLAKLGPALLAVLEALHLTPRARASKGGTSSGGSSPLDELRQRRARRDRATPVDPAAP